MDEQNHQFVENLIRLVENSGCTFKRNGSFHPSKRAADHLREKMTYHTKSIKKAEDFVDIVATKSYWTGNPYTFRCDGDNDDRKVGPWLYENLKQIKNQPK